MNIWGQHPRPWSQPFGGLLLPCLPRTGPNNPCLCLSCMKSVCHCNTKYLYTLSQSCKKYRSRILGVTRDHNKGTSTVRKSFLHPNVPTVTLYKHKTELRAQSWSFERMGTGAPEIFPKCMVLKASCHILASQMLRETAANYNTSVSIQPNKESVQTMLWKLAGRAARAAQRVLFPPVLALGAGERVPSTQDELVLRLLFRTKNYLPGRAVSGVKAR